ncbi:hypothetical protein [Pyxidicoccus xibeiensis]|uniref:hypothetical protein n=1 Tax=Pyxidicoccus xibeiensis TaxID=2906759 RepID=UPI0020A79677|nr:hypothetical protein [Pyxidicoccus xibeiensis]MCP3144957.1 hypothetical protein [Pyxidicoccus xibeiensis]
MKRSALAPRGTLAALLTCAAVSGACSDTEVRTGVAGLSGTYDLTLVNDLVFVTSSDRDELRVLDLSANPMQFIPAPNPLEALSIPVLERPDALTRDVGYDDAGADVPGPYVYARSSGSSKISVVAADRQRLVQVTEPLETGSLVTAFAARAPTPGGSATSTLYYAIQDPDGAFEADTGGARVMRQELPGPEALEAGTAVPPAAPVFCLQPGESVQAMVVLKGAGELVVATRQSSGRSGRTLLVTDAGPLASCLQPTAPTVDMSPGFGNVPVRQLATHPRVRFPDDSIVPANRYVFGIRDEAACGGGRECSGVVAVDTTTPTRAERALDAGGAPMLPIFASGGLPTGLALIPDARLQFRLDEGTPPPALVPLLGLMPSSNGDITLFSASDLRQFDLSSATPTATVELRNRNEALLAQQTANLVEVTQDPSLQSTVLYEGSVSSGVFRFVYQGALQGLVGLARSPEDPRLFEAEASAATLARAGDLIILDSADAECATALTVAAVTPVPGTTRVRFTLGDTEQIPEECAGLGSFTVRAGGDQPFVLQDAGGGFLSRDVLVTAYAIATEYFYHPIGFSDVSKFPQPPPPLLMRVTSVARELVRGDRYVVTVSSGIRNYIFDLDVEDPNAGLGLYTLPGAVAASQAGGQTLRAYIAYPSADGILQVSLEGVVDNVSNSLPLTPFE